MHKISHQVGKGQEKANENNNPNMSVNNVDNN